MICYLSAPAHYLIQTYSWIVINEVHYHLSEWFIRKCERAQSLKYVRKLPPLKSQLHLPGADELMVS